MNQSSEKQEVFGDYAAFLHSLLPQAQGFLFHDRHAMLFWHDSAPDTSQLGDEYHTALKRILETGVLPGESARIPLRDSVAYLVRLVSDKGRSLGVLTALVDRDMGNMAHKFCSDLLKPAVRSMERELSLRVHLLDATRKINDHSHEYEFLRELGDQSRRSGSCTEAVQAILQLCVDQLPLDGAVFLSPDHELNIAAGANPVEFAEAELMFESLQEIAESAPQGNVEEALSNRPAHDPREAARCWPVLADAKRLTGVLILSRRADQARIAPRTTGLAGFVVSTLEHMLEKGFDPVTGLMNWPAFEAALEAAWAENPDSCSVMYLDVDQLHVANDTFGREAGDRVLRQLARTMRDIIPQHPLTRVTSDSFAVLLRGVDLETAKRLGKQICLRAKSLEHNEGERSYRLSLSIGVAPLANESDEVASALVPAQVACQAAKDRGRGRVEVYEAGDQSIVRRFDDLKFVGSIRSAIEGGRLVLFAQPIVKSTGPDKEAYYELLVRMLNTAGEPVPPSEFMGAAERYQLMQDLDRWVVAKAIETLTEQLSDSHGRPLRFAVNLSGQSLGSEKFLSFVKSELARTGLPPERLCLEITETVAVSNLKNAQKFIAELQALGCLFSLDDFGTGLSSFAYLKMFKVNKLKIDGSFVQDICSNEVSRSMVTAIAEIARVMGIETVAEYVQDEATLELIRELGVDWAQGYHVGEPVRLRSLFGNSTIIDKADLADVDPALMENLPA